MKLNYLARWGVTALLALFLVSCAEPPPPPPPAIVNLTVSAADNINPNASGRASPIVVRVYYLVSPTVFSEADFFALFEQDKAVLGADLAASDEFVLGPGGSKALSREVRDDVRFVGLLASFRNIDNAVWRGVAPVPPNKTTAVTGLLDELTLSLSAATAP